MDSIKTTQRIAAPERPAGPAGLRVVGGAVELARDIRLAVAGIGRHADLLDQLVRAAESVALNLAEGAGRVGRDKACHYHVAYGSAGEAATAIGLLAAYGAISDRRAADLLGRLDELRAVAWRLAHPA